MPIYKLTNPRWDEDAIIVGCECGHNEHQLVISLWPEDDNPTEFYVSPHLRMYKGFFKRLWAAVRYIFGHKSKYGHYGEVVLSPSDVEEMFKFFDKHIDDLVENREQWQ